MAREASALPVGRTRTLAEDEAAVGRRFAEPEAGHRIARYEIRHPLGEGGMGTVHVAYDPNLQRDVALKLIHPERAGSEQARARFIVEARSMAKVVHPNVVEVYDAGVSEGRPYVVMELVRGTTLAGWLRQEHPERVTLAHLRAAGLGLAAAHAAGLIHRDFKPANVLIGDDGRVRVSDFGLARALEETASVPPLDVETTGPGETTGSLTKTGMVLGSPVYMAPEQHDGGASRIVDARADQFAYAVTVFEAMVGQRPFSGGGLVALLEGKLKGPPAVPASTAWLRRFGPVIRRALQPDPEQRWDSVDAFVAALASSSRARRPVALAGAAIGVGLLGIAMMTPSETRCALDAQRRDALWGETQRAAVGDAFAASGRAHAATTAPRVAAQLDARTAAWFATYQAACLAEGDRLDARMGCLDDQRERLTKTIDRLSNADADVVDQGIAIAASGPSPERCLAPDPAEADLIGELDPALRARAEAIRETLRDAKKLEHLGHPSQALAMTERALADARDVGHPPLLAFALTTHASALESSGAYDEASPLLYEAAQTAEAAGAWRQAAAAQIEAVFLEGYRRGNPDEAMRLARSAQAALDRGGSTSQLQASLANNIGAVHHSQRDLVAACDSMSVALAVREADPDAYSNAVTRAIAMAAARENLAACLTMSGRSIEALPLLEAAVEESTAVYGPNNPQVASVHQALGSALDSVGRYAEALEHIDIAIALRKHNLREDDPLIAEAIAERGYALSSSGRLAEAVDAMRDAADRYERAVGRDDPKPWAYRANAAEALIGLGRIDEAAELVDEALRRLLVLTEPGDLSRLAAHGASGKIALSRGDAAGALRHAEAALSDSTLAHGADVAEHSPILLDIARAHRALGSDATAKEALERAVDVAASDPLRKPIHAGEAYFELAQLVADADPERAKSLAEVALQVYGRHGEHPERHADVSAWLATRR